MEIIKFTLEGKEAALHRAEAENRPLMVFNTFAGDGSAVLRALPELEEQDFNFLCVGNLNWAHDLTPWYCPPLAPTEPPCTGGADDYLRLLLTEILPRAGELVRGKPPYTGIVGYSLAGLFALYACCRCGAFDRAASISGSLWYPDFKDYVCRCPMPHPPELLYLSLGDKEAKTGHPLLKTVQRNTEELAEYFRAEGLNVVFEMNPGNHFKQEALRTARGILALLQKTR